MPKRQSRQFDDSQTRHFFQAMVPMRDGIRLNTFVFLPTQGGPTFPIILQRTPYGISLPESASYTDPHNGWLPSSAQPLRGSNYPKPFVDYINDQILVSGREDGYRVHGT